MGDKLVNLGLHAWRDFIEKAQERVTMPALEGGGDASVNEGNLEWSGGTDLAGAIHMARFGWQEGTKEISRLLDSLPPMTEECLPEWILEVAGVIPVVPVMLAGDPQCMLHREANFGAARRLALCIPCSYNCVIKAKQAINYATAIAAVVRAIEASGITVAVYGMAADRGSGRVVYGIVARDFSEPLDLAKIAFTFHAAFLRRVIFAWSERNERAIAAGIASQGYGSSVQLEPSDAAAMMGESECPRIVLPTMGHDGNLPLDDLTKLVPYLREKVAEGMKPKKGGVAAAA